MKNLFIGIDFSKKTFDVSLFERDKLDVISYHRFDNRKDGYKELVAWVKSSTGIKTAEWLFCGEHTGLYSLGLTEFLVGKGLFIWLENPLQIKLSSGIKREKNDKVDSREIALYAYRFEDKAIATLPADKDLSSLSLLLAFRERLVRNKKALLVSAVEMRSVLTRNPMARYIYEQSQRDVERLNKEIKEVEKKMMEIIEASSELKENYQLVISIKGIALINTVAIMIHTANFTRFDNPRQLACYAGVVPFGKSSGTSLNKPKRTSSLANRQIKTLLTQAARCAVKHDVKLRIYYHRKLKQGKDERLVINNVRNKLIHTIFAVVKNKQFYQTDYKNENAVKTI
ncbi:IS110 family transposase [Bacteroidia bacterium]|nr:IS110 family transposase [Bacteroidia bacterium]GHU13614.1 IS110 family transposase [Betaproteobacteria bacterium]